MIAGKIIGAFSGPRASRPPAGRRPAVRSYHRGSSIWRLESQLLRDFGFPAVAVREKPFLVIEKLFAGFGGKLEIRPLDDRIDRASLLAVAAINAFRHIDIVARRTSAAVLARLGFDCDRQRRADRL